jgi:hypothetical protein
MEPNSKRQLTKEILKLEKGKALGYLLGQMDHSLEEFGKMISVLKVKC